MKDRLIFRFKQSPGNYYFVDLAGNVNTDIIPRNIESSVVDWNILKLQYVRNSQYHGVFRKQAPETVNFANDAASILRYVYNTLGASEAKCTFEILKLRSTDQEYYSLGDFDIDFGKPYSSTIHFVTAGLMQGGASALLNAYDTLDNEITIGSPDPADPLYDADADWLYMDGVLVKGRYNYETEKSSHTLLHRPSGTSLQISYTFGIVYIDEDGGYNVIDPKYVMRDILTGPLGVTFENAPLARNVQSFSGILKVNLEFALIDALIGNATDVKLQLRATLYDNASYSSTILADAVIWTDPFGWITAGSSSTTTIAAATWAQTFPQGSFLVLAFEMVSSGSGANDLTVILSPNATPITIDYDYITPTTACRALKHMKVFQKLTAKVTNGLYAANSSLLSTSVYPGPDVLNINPADTFFTSGDCLRNIAVTAEGVPTKPAMKISMADFAKDAFVSLCAGIGIEKDIHGNDVVVLEHLSHFYQKDVLIKDLGKVKDWKKYPYTEYLGNSIKAGYEDQDYDEVNGRYEINSEVVWKAPVTRIQKDVDNKSPLRTDPEGVEFVRVNKGTKTTTDASSDNDTFKIQSNGNRLGSTIYTPNPYQLDRGHTVTAGLLPDIAPTLYNFGFSPKRQMLRLLPFTKSVHYGLLSPKLTFQTATKNAELISSMYTGPVVNEKSDIPLSSDGTDIIFIPEVLEFIAEVPMDLDLLMNTTPYGVFGHTVTKDQVDHYLEGFVLDVGLMPGTDNTYNFKLLCSPNTPIPTNL